MREPGGGGCVFERRASKKHVPYPRPLRPNKRVRASKGAPREVEALHARARRALEERADVRLGGRRQQLGGVGVHRAQAGARGGGAHELEQRRAREQHLLLCVWGGGSFAVSRGRVF